LLTRTKGAEALKLNQLLPSYWRNRVNGGLKSCYDLEIYFCNQVSLFALFYYDVIHFKTALCESIICAIA
jgi:hypothetical protein